MLTDYLNAIEEDLKKELQEGRAEKFGNGIIERLEGDWQRWEPGRGYRFENVEGYAFYDVYWKKISGHYLIQEQSRRRQIISHREPKPIMGPIPLEILEGDRSEESVDQRCLAVLKSIISREAHRKGL